MRIKFTSDSTCDLSREQLEQFDITILPLAVAMGGKDHRDGVDILPADIYAHVAAGGDLPKTAAVNIAQYQECWEGYARDYDAIIHLNISAEFSSCHQNAKLAAEEFDNVYVVDSRNLSTGHGLLVLKGIELAKQGMAAADIAQVLREAVGKVNASFILDQLEYLKKGGRCSTLAAMGANLLKLKPCIEVKDGKMAVGKKYRGTYEKCMKEYIADQLKDRTDLDLSQVFVTHSGIDEALIQAAVDAVNALQSFENLTITTAGCTISSHCGPGTMGVLFMTK